VRSEVLLHALEERGVYVSSGSACSSNHPGISGTLKAIGVDRSCLDSTLRFSFSYETTMEQLDYTIGQLRELVPMLARYTRK
jgi:cysteine desulfurase